MNVNRYLRKGGDIHIKRKNQAIREESQGVFMGTGFEDGDFGADHHQDAENRASKLNYFQDYCVY